MVSGSLLTLGIRYCVVSLEQFEFCVIALTPLMFRSSGGGVADDFRPSMERPLSPFFRSNNKFQCWRVFMWQGESAATR